MEREEEYVLLRKSISFFYFLVVLWKIFFWKVFKDRLEVIIKVYYLNRFVLEIVFWKFEVGKKGSLC